MSTTILPTTTTTTTRMICPFGSPATMRAMPMMIPMRRMRTNTTNGRRCRSPVVPRVSADLRWPLRRAEEEDGVAVPRLLLRRAAAVAEEPLGTMTMTTNTMPLRTSFDPVDDAAARRPVVADPRRAVDVPAAAVAAVDRPVVADRSSRTVGGSSSNPRRSLGAWRPSAIASPTSKPSRTRPCPPSPPRGKPPPSSRPTSTARSRASPRPSSSRSCSRRQSPTTSPSRASTSSASSALPTRSPAATTSTTPSCASCGTRWSSGIGAPPSSRCTSSTASRPTGLPTTRPPSRPASASCAAPAIPRGRGTSTSTPRPSSPPTRRRKSSPSRTSCRGMPTMSCSGRSALGACSMKSLRRVPVLVRPRDPPARPRPRRSPSLPRLSAPSIWRRRR
mmetsp:Transcript_26262/g.75837  ORF Transcript_26262/g.75837 Transcript_26262/m.75837 type:complete len:391 (-) Transcript_26262:319-1491(-)